MSFTDLIHHLIDLIRKLLFHHLQYVIVCIVNFLLIDFLEMKMSNLRVIFSFFFNYWKVVAKRGTELSGLQVTIATSYNFNMLRVECKKMVGL